MRFGYVQINGNDSKRYRSQSEMLSETHGERGRRKTYLVILGYIYYIHGYTTVLSILRGTS